MALLVTPFLLITEIGNYRAEIGNRQSKIGNFQTPVTIRYQRVS
jgi:hypothetical protein